jgi:hypothetical protein
LGTAPNFLCRRPGKTAMCCLQLSEAPGDRMDLEIPHNQKRFYSKNLFQNNTVFSRNLTFLIPKYVTYDAKGEQLEALAMGTAKKENRLRVS